jgi:uncharacterized membrane protein
MHHREFSKHLDEKSIVAAIHRAETNSSAQVRVFICHHHVDDALDAARSQFHLLGMEKTQHRNAVLVYVAPHSRKFAIFGDIAIDEKCGMKFWETVRDETIAHLKQGQFSAALVHAVDCVGQKLARHFPPDGVRINELPDEIAHD